MAEHTLNQEDDSDYLLGERERGISMSYHGMGEERVVCVTGASGFIASWLVKLLLHKGYTVNASVRDPRDTKKTEHLVGLEGAKERLHLFKAELLEEGSFDSAIQGCVGVFHTASPVSFSASDPQVEIVDPAVNGTLNVLKSCAKSPCVKRVILTASISSAFYTGKPVTQDSVADETWFSDPAVCQRHQFWYQLGKTLAETAAWEFAKENGIDLVTMHPAYVFGPFLQPTICYSLGLILNLVNGETYPANYCWSVDVRDVAEAHVKAFETSSASGRYLLVGNNVEFPQVLHIIHQLYPDLPHKCGDTSPATLPRFKASSKKAEQELGINFTPLETTLKDTIECFKEKGFLHL